MTPKPLVGKEKHSLQPRCDGRDRSSAPAAWLHTADLPALLGPLCTATEALARLDARAAAAHRLLGRGPAGRCGVGLPAPGGRGHPGVAAAGCHRGAAAHAVSTPKALTGKLGIAPRRPCCGSRSRMER